MKKLMIAAAIVCAAAFAQAGAISWSCGTMTLSDGTATTVAGQLTGYLFMIEKDAYDTYVADYTTSGKVLSDQLWKDFGESLGDADANKNALKSGKLNTIQVMDGENAKDYSAGTYYAALLITDNVNDGYYMGNIGTAVVEGSLEVEVTSMGSQIFGSNAPDPATATAWSVQSVPEPTSGLLLLLGMAGLALRRRRV